MKRNLVLIMLFCSGIAASVPFMAKQAVHILSLLTKRELDETFRVLGLQHFGIELILLSTVLLLKDLVKNRNAFFSLTMVALIGLYFVFLFQYAVNVPITDDYKTILQFSNQYFFTADAPEKISLLTSFHYECRLITTRMIVVASYFITGAVNFKQLIIFANCCLPVILYFFYRAIPVTPFRQEITLMIALLLFHFGYYDAVVWATDALHYQFTLLFLMICLYLLNKNSVASIIGSLLAALLGGLTFGNGLLIFPLAILFFMLKNNWRLVFIWSMISVLFIFIYFQGALPGTPRFYFFPLKDYFIYSCCFLGSAFQFMYELYVPFVSGLLILVLFTVLTVKKYYRKNYFVYGLFVFVILSSFIAAHHRLHMGLAESISNRYGIFSVLITGAAVIALTEMGSKKITKTQVTTMVFFCMTYHLLSGIFFFPEVPVRKQKLESFIIDIKKNRPFEPVFPIIPEGADYIVKEAMHKKIYFP